MCLSLSIYIYIHIYIYIYIYTYTYMTQSCPEHGRATDFPSARMALRDRRRVRQVPLWVLWCSLFSY